MSTPQRIASLLALVFLPAFCQACPFCSAVSQTFSEEMDSMDVVAVAKLVVAPPISAFDDNDSGGDVPKSQFEVTEVLKGDSWVRPGQMIETIYFGEAKKDRPFLMMGTDAPNLMWSTPLVLSDRARKYVKKLHGLPLPDSSPKAADDPQNATMWAERLVFFQEYLEDEDEMLARDAYDEFAKAPYPAVIALKPRMNHPRLLGWIRDPEVPSNRRRLYFTMLGVCGSPEDATLLESLMRSSDRKEKAGLDAMIACYLILRKQDGLNLVNELFLKSPDAEYADTYAAIMAIRFHGSQVDVVPKSQLVKSLRLMLSRPELADLVIPDLARWEDWEVMPTLVQLFKDADENSSWVRVPVINYLRVCPRPEAKKHIEELAKIDPDAVKRAQTFFPLGPPTETPDSEEAGGSKASPPAATSNPSSALLHFNRTSRSAAALTHFVAASAIPVEPTGQQDMAGEQRDQAEQDRAADDERDGNAVANANEVPSTLAQAELLADTGPSSWRILSVAMLIGICLLFAMRAILGYGRHGLT